jgi:23S rRNA pseudouridine1911/1915/1917 synthase
MIKGELYLHKTLNISDIKEGQRIDLYLSRRFPETGRTQFQKQIINKWIKVNDRFVSKGYKVYPNDKIDIYTPYKSKLDWIANESVPLDIVFEDKHLIVINKTAGVQVHPASGNYDNTLINGLVFYLKKKNGKVFLVHRLDKFTSGLLVFAKNEQTQDVLSQAFSDKESQRTYTALVWGRMDDMGTIDLPIGRLPSNPKRFGALGIEDGGKKAITHYSSLHNFPFHSLIECKLETGRTHQIRVHMQSQNNPIIGDWEYGGNRLLFGKRDPDYMLKMDELLGLFKGQALHASRLSFPHPITKETLYFEAELPENFAQGITILNGIEY